MKKVDAIIHIAQRLADERNELFAVKGPGAGDRDTSAFIRELRYRACDRLGRDYSEKLICGEGLKLSVDYYIPEEATIVEIALGLRNPKSEFERDIFKALLAQEVGYRVHKLVFVSKPGAMRRHAQPGSAAIMRWVRRTHGLIVEIRELSDSAPA